MTSFAAEGDGIITTVAGNGSAGFSGDGGPATLAALDLPWSVAVDSSGNLFIVDLSHGRIRKVSTNGNITTVAGGGSAFGDGVSATSALLFPVAVAVDASGNLFIADALTNRIRRVSTNGVITTVAGSFSPGGGESFSGDGGPAILASLYFPTGVAVDVFGNLFIADTLNDRIRKVSTNGVITTVAGNGNFAVPSDSGGVGLATSVSLHLPSGVAVDASGSLFIVDAGNFRVLKVSSNGVMTTIADGLAFDAGMSATSGLVSPTAVAVDAFGNVLIADAFDIRSVSTSGAITIVAGNGGSGFSGDGGPATSASLSSPNGVAVDTAGNIFIADSGNNREGRFPRRFRLFCPLH